jgi:hypothetical protein
MEPITLILKLDDFNLSRTHIYTGDHGKGKYIPSARAHFNLCQPVKDGSFGRGQENAALTLHITDRETIEMLHAIHHEAAMRDCPSATDSQTSEWHRGRAKFKLTLEALPPEESPYKEEA